MLSEFKVTQNGLILVSHSVSLFLLTTSLHLANVCSSSYTNNSKRSKKRKQQLVYSSSSSSSFSRPAVYRCMASFIPVQESKKNCLFICLDQYAVLNVQKMEKTGLDDIDVLLRDRRDWIQDKFHWIYNQKWSSRCSILQLRELFCPREDFFGFDCSL